MQIGKKIRELRKAEHLTLQELSKTSGVALATLSRIETGRMTGTLESHMNIAKALGISLVELYGNIVIEDKNIDIQSQKERSDVFVHSDKSSYEILTSKVLSKKMMPIMLKIEAGGKTPQEEARLGTEKFIYVIKGKVEAVISEKSYELDEGDSLYFDASLPHFYKNKTKTLAQFICVISPPTL